MTASALSLYLYIYTIGKLQPGILKAITDQTIAFRIPMIALQEVVNRGGRSKRPLQLYIYKYIYNIGPLEPGYSKGYSRPAIAYKIPRLVEYGRVHRKRRVPEPVATANVTLSIYVYNIREFELGYSQGKVDQGILKAIPDQTSVQDNIIVFMGFM